MEREPIGRFDKLYARARESVSADATAAALATAGGDAQPSVRIVLLKGFDDSGFVFYTNLRSRKALDLAENPKASLCFWWAEIGEQVRIEGEVVQVEDAEADKYFASRPRGSQLGAWASDQSHEIESRQALVRRFAELEEEYSGKDVPRPAHWSGYRLVPERIEFWSSRENRLHERHLYTRDGDGWRTSILSP